MLCPWNAAIQWHTVKPFITVILNTRATANDSYGWLFSNKMKAFFSLSQRFDLGSKGHMKVLTFHLLLAQWPLCVTEVNLEQWTFKKDSFPHFGRIQDLWDSDPLCCVCVGGFTLISTNFLVISPKLVNLTGFLGSLTDDQPFHHKRRLLIPHDFKISGERQMTIRLNVRDQLRSNRNNASPEDQTSKPCITNPMLYLTGWLAVAWGQHPAVEPTKAVRNNL